MKMKNGKQKTNNNNNWMYGTIMDFQLKIAKKSKIKSTIARAYTCIDTMPYLLYASTRVHVYVLSYSSSMLAS